MRKTVYLSLGGNLGDREGYLRYAVSRLSGLPGTEVEAVSGLYSTKPWGGVAQDDFLNCCVRLSTEFAPMELLDKIHGIEDDCGRTREVRWGPRTLDIDILLYEGYKSEDEKLTVPHREMAGRAFVMVPLLEIWNGEGDFSFTPTRPEGEVAPAGALKVEAFFELAKVTQKVYDGKIIRVRRDDALLPDGKTAIREVVEHTGGVAIVALDEDENVLLVRQFRYPLGLELIEIPAGTLKPNEDPRLCGIRELEEETGAKAERFTSLGQIYPCAGFTNEIIYLYMAEGLSFGQLHLDDDEYLSVSRMPLTELVDRILSGEICDGKTVAAILKVWAFRKNK